MRHHAVLTCSRVKGRHTYDVLAAAMQSVHAEFDLQDKLTRTTTDNGSNFVKAFEEFADIADILPAIPELELEEEADDETEDEVQEVQLADIPYNIVELIGSPEEEAVEVEHLEVEEILAEDSTGTNTTLPTHMRCAAHTYNLVATKDAEAAIMNDPVFKAICRKVMGKAKALWNLQNRSTVVADKIVDLVGRRLLVPNETRWNATYYAVVVLNRLLQEKM